MNTKVNVNRVSEHLLCETPDWCDYEEDDWDYEYALDEFKQTIEERIIKYNPNGYYKIIAENMGWDRRSGYKVARIQDYSDLCNALFNCFSDFHARVHSYYTKGLYIRVTHHDNPVSGDKYYLIPISERTYQEYV